MSSILVVDDEPVATRLLKLRLESEGHAVEVAENGEDALGLLRGSAFDLVITDICMPQMDGRELCETIRRDHPDGRPFIIVLSSRPEDEYRAWTRELPNLEFMEKPVSLRSLAASVARHLGAPCAAEEPPA